MMWHDTFSFILQGRRLLQRKKNAIKDSELKKMCCQVQPLYKHLHNYRLKEKRYITDDSKGKETGVGETADRMREKE